MNALSASHGVQKPTRKYNRVLKAKENEVGILQQLLQQEQQRQQYIVEQNLVLSELLHTQERLQAVYDKQQHWLSVGGAHPAGSCGLQMEPEAANDAHWVVYLLETASWEQLQQALSMSCSDWAAYHKQYCSELTRLAEVHKRCPEVQSSMLQGITAIPAQQGPAVYLSSSNISPSNSSGSDASGSNGNCSSSPAFDVIVDKLKTTGKLAYLALLHGTPAIFEAASKNLQTGEESHAPPQHWLTVARRMHFSRQQKLHFKLALQNFARQARAAAARGLSVLQDTPSYAFLLACEAIAVQQLGSEQEGSCRPTDPPASGTFTAATAAEPMDSCNGNSLGSGDASGIMKLDAAAGPAMAGAVKSNGASIPPGASAAPAGPGGVGTAAAAAAPLPAAGSCGVAPAAPVGSDGGGDGGAASQESNNEVVDLSGPSSPIKELQRSIALYYQQVVSLNIFLADTLTLEQALYLNVASYPFWPMLSAVAEAAIQLPDCEQMPESAVPEEDRWRQQGIGLLMSRRQEFMQQTHYQWWNDYGKPTADGPDGPAVQPGPVGL